MKFKNKLFTIPGVLFLSLTSCGTADISVNAPDYTKDTGEFITYGYASPTNGTYYIDGVPINVGENFQTVERYIEYKEAGLNTMMLQFEDRYPLPGESLFADSHCKKLMDLCVDAGIQRCIITDGRYRDLSVGSRQIIGPGCEFANQKELNEYVIECIRDYFLHPVFYGVLLRDEPFYNHLEPFGQVYQAVKNAGQVLSKEYGVEKDIYIEANLLPYTVGETQRQRYTPDWQSLTDEEAYEDYLLRFLNNSKADKILMDDYPFRYSNGEVIKTNYFKGIQILANFCKKHNLRFEAVGQSMGGGTTKRRTWSMPTLPTFEWQFNHFMGMGVKAFAFFTYFRKVSNSTAENGEWFNDGESFITSYGEKTSVYYNAQTLLNEMQALAPVILNFDYQASKVISTPPMAYPIAYADIHNDEFVCFKDEDVKINDGRLCYISELYDEEKNNYMYMMENIMDPRIEASEGVSLLLEYSIDFGSKFDAVEVYYRGNRKLVPLKDGVYSSVLDPGYAEFLIPYKA